MKVVHLTSAHERFDTRIFYKMCCSLSNKKYDVHLIVADGNGYEEKFGVQIHDLGAKSGSRLARITKTASKILKAALSLNGDIYHLHDPELLLLVPFFKRHGKKVVFDSHEDFPKQILSKAYLSKWQARVFSIVAEKVEKLICSRIDGVVAATPFIRNKFESINGSVVDVNNYPIAEEFDINQNKEVKSGEFVVTYVGNITKVRGIEELLLAFDKASEPIVLSVAGKFSEESLEKKVKNSEVWKAVDDLGWLNREGVSSLLSRSSVGVVTLHPTINYKDALPVKMFEYMAAGVAVIATDVPYWREIVETSGCGVLVDPFDTDAFSEILDSLAKNPKLCESYGVNGIKAIKDKYNWKNEERKLFDFYTQITKEV